MMGEVEAGRRVGIDDVMRREATLEMLMGQIDFAGGEDQLSGGPYGTVKTAIR